MFLQPKKTKHKKLRKGRLKKTEFKNTGLIFGTAGLKATSSGTISARTIEAVRRSIVRKLERKGKVWFKTFPCNQITSKPSESRMGKGKGGVSFWSFKVARGQVIVEVAGVPGKTAVEALTAGGHKLPVKSRIFTW